MDEKQFIEWLFGDYVHVTDGKLDKRGIARALNELSDCLCWRFDYDLTDYPVYEHLNEKLGQLEEYLRKAIKEESESE